MSANERRPRGRSVYDPGYCELVLELAAKGCGKAEIAAELSVSGKTLHAWAKANPEFRDSLLRAKELEYAWWLKQGREGQFNKAWNAASWALQMGSRFGKRFAGGAKPQEKEKQKDIVNAEQLRAGIERKLSRITDAGAEAEVSGGPDAGGAGGPGL